MIVIKKVVKNKEGGYDTNWSLTDDQVSFLMTYAINNLLAEGLLSVEEVPEQLNLDLAVPEGSMQ